MINTKQFALAGDATFTVTSKRSGTRFTYKVELSKDGKRHFVKLLCGPDNWMNYKYFGFINDRGEFRHAKPTSTKITPEAPSAKGFAFLWRNIDNKPIYLKTTNQVIPRPLDELFEIHHEGKCCRCGRKLTVPESIEMGVGPECAALMGF